MTSDEVLQILTTLQAVYPHAYRGMKAKDAMALKNLWERVFANENSREVSAAVDAILATRTVGYAVTPGEVKEMMQKLRAARDKTLSESEAWALVAKACTNGIYGYREEFAKLPPDVQAAVGRPEQLREWAMMDTETLQSVVASNFQRSFRTMQKRNRELEMLPESARRTIADLADSMKMLPDK